MTSNMLVMTSSALVGYSIATDKSLATLPLALQFLATMAATIPASMLMKRVGRKLGFLLGAGIWAAGAGLSIHAIFAADFVLFCVGAALIGAFNAFALYYRFAAADVASEAFRSRAISYVMAGGVLASIIGPELAKGTVDLFAPVLFAGVYACILVLAALTVGLLLLMDIPAPSAEEWRRKGRPILEIMRQPVFIVAVLGGMIGYGVMSLVMVATPLAMVACSLAFDDTAFVIQWHALGMWAPAFFTGHLIRRFGTTTVMLAGAVLAVGAVVSNLSGTDIANFWVGLVLLGIGWNFLFVGSTTLLTEVYTPDERAKTQAVNDFFVFGTVSVAALSSGALNHAFGWQAVNASVLPLIGVVVGALVWLRRRRPALAV